MVIMDPPPSSTSTATTEDNTDNDSSLTPTNTNTKDLKKKESPPPETMINHFPHVLNEPLKDALGQQGIYTGNTFRGIPHHKGRMMYIKSQSSDSNKSHAANDADGNSVESYVGDWQLGYWHGSYGVCTLRNGDIYKGPFIKHERHGLMGDYIWKETSQVVQQQLPNNNNNNNKTQQQRSNKGQLLIKKRHYQGSFYHNQRQGHGKYTWKTYSGTTLVSISTYVGMFDNGLRQGHGIYTSPKLTYSGEWYQGSYHGYGVLETIKSKTTKYVYKGYFIKGKRDGRGCETAVTTKTTTTKTKSSDNDDDDSNSSETTSTTLIRHDGLWKNDLPVEEPKVLPPQVVATKLAVGGGKEEDNINDNKDNKDPLPGTIKKEGVENDDDDGFLQSSTSSNRSTTTSHTTTVLSTFEPVQDADGRWGSYRGIVQDGLPQGVGTIHYDGGDISSVDHHPPSTLESGGSERRRSHHQNHHPEELVKEKEEVNHIKTYEGFWQAGVKHGFGRCQYKNGDTYVGQFVQGKRQGQGEYNTTGSRNNRNNNGNGAGSLNYKGLFYNDKPHGESMTVVYDDYNNGSKYLFQGSFSHGSRLNGRLEFLSTGGYYQGEFDNSDDVNNLYSGKGELATETTIYIGEFKNGLYHGIGTLRNAISNEILIDNGQFEYGKLVNIKNKDDKNKEGTADCGGDDEENAKNLIKAAELEAFLEEENIPQPPLDLNWNNLFPKEEEKFLSNNLLEKLRSSLTPVQKPKPTISSSFSSMLTSSHSTSTSTTSGGGVGGGNNSNSNSKPSGGFLAGLIPSLTSHNEDGGAAAAANNNNKNNNKDEACHAVVDLAVWDGQDNPGRYTGLLHISSQRPHGVGRMVYNDGNRIHEGFWEYGHRQGHGRCLFVQIGDYHEGDYHANLRHGRGKYYWKDGRQYIGQYHNDERHGKDGKFIYPNGDLYKGDFENGQRSGFGTFTFNKKTCLYKGGWKKGVYHGQGLLRWKTPKGEDQQYEGGFSQGLFCGKGEERIDNRLLRKGIYKGGRLVEEEKDTSQDDDDEMDNTKDGPGSMPIMEFSVPAHAASSINKSNNSNDDDDDIDNEELEDPDDVAAAAADVITTTISEDEEYAAAAAEAASPTKKDQKAPPQSGDGRPVRQKRIPRALAAGKFKGRDAPSSESRAPPDRTKSSKIAEAPSSTEQTVELKRAQWKNSLDINGDIS